MGWDGSTEKDFAKNEFKAQFDTPGRTKIVAKKGRWVLVEVLADLSEKIKAGQRVAFVQLVRREGVWTYVKFVSLNEGPNTSEMTNFPVAWLQDPALAKDGYAVEALGRRAQAFLTKTAFDLAPLGSIQVAARGLGESRRLSVVGRDRVGKGTFLAREIDAKGRHGKLYRYDSKHYESVTTEGGV